MGFKYETNKKIPLRFDAVQRLDRKIKKQIMPKIIKRDNCLNTIKKLKSDGWYKVETSSDLYYTPFTRSKERYVAHGDGYSIPKPKEIAEYLTKNDTHFYEDTVFKYYEQTTPAGESVELPTGIYRYYHSSERIPERLSPFELRNDSYIELGSKCEQVVKDIHDFLKHKDLYDKHGMFYKLGILMYGPPGNGKTLLVRRILEQVDTEKAITIFLDSDLPSDQFIVKLKTLLADQIKIFVFEELLASTHNRNIDRLLTFLDGELSMDNSILLATTNYPEKLPGNIVDRPSRFDKLYKFAPPNDGDRKKLLEHFLQREITIHELDITKGLSIAALKEISLQAIIQGRKLEESVKNMKRRSELCKKAFSNDRDEQDYDDFDYGF